MIRYFTSFSWTDDDLGSGVGSSVVDLDYKLNTWENIQKLTETLKKDSEHGNLIIVHFVELDK